MGFMDKLKSAKNFVTGGAAELDVEVGEVAVGGTMPLRIVCKVKDQDVDIRRVYLKVKAVELEEFIDVTHYPSGRVRVDEEYDQYATYRDEIDVDEAQTLTANEEYFWEGEIEIPSNVHPTVHGDGFAHQWFILAALDTAGNDPDSDWLEFEVCE